MIKSNLIKTTRLSTGHYSMGIVVSNKNTKTYGYFDKSNQT